MFGLEANLEVNIQEAKIKIAGSHAKKNGLQEQTTQRQLKKMLRNSEGLLETQKLLQYKLKARQKAS